MQYKYLREYHVHRMIDWIENNIENPLSLQSISKEIGYSPTHCSMLFSEVCQISMKQYIAGRRLFHIANDLRNTNERILDIALRYGFSSHETLTHAFKAAYNITPTAYRNDPIPLRLMIRKIVLCPDQIQSKGGITMSKVKEISVKIEFIPAHKYIGIWDINASNYGAFWNYHDCDDVCGIIESMRDVAHPIVGPHRAGWFYQDGKKGYFYGFGVDKDYDGVIPDGFSIRDVAESYYMAFSHGTFDYLTENCVVMPKLENIAWNWDFTENKEYGLPDTFEWDYDSHCYQLHHPEYVGYQIHRAVKMK